MGHRIKLTLLYCITTINNYYYACILQTSFPKHILIKNYSPIKSIVFFFFLCSYGDDRIPAVIDDLSCLNSTYLTIFQCSYSTSVSSSCTAENDVSVSCCKFISQ